MLTLTRSVGERIYIGDDIVIEVRAILDGRQVRISIDAPRQVPIHRAEIFEAVSRQNRSAALDGDASGFTKLLDGAGVGAASRARTELPPRRRPSPAAAAAPLNRPTTPPPGPARPRGTAPPAASGAPAGLAGRSAGAGDPAGRQLGVPATVPAVDPAAPLAGSLPPQDGDEQARQTGEGHGAPPSARRSEVEDEDPGAAGAGTAP